MQLFLDRSLLKRKLKKKNHRTSKGFFLQARMRKRDRLSQNAEGGGG